ncbi:ABC transporter substrate-binding protein [Cellulosilyticum lentocellum]|uniref:ABC-type transporter, periplasmic subunit n=1 Tax=Cellulosilyticum lentocellum (strain ATCC 49066 / DSM 5427 / NCIMB 11756 / RHM5) TaxID=642492 RepID=F2JIJ7_CELLD|nr:ABC transporter substrate-binding protein [Cellulosilyticum lentocellum]ADZ85467.1 ABC-type transporter, periplasmic subunit [Cellulosilyticum lentocellum DSM 5427]
MKKKLALVIAPLLAVTMLVGCGGNSSSQAGDKPAASAEAGTAADANIADTLVFAQGAEPRGLDPAFVDDGESSKVIVNVYEGLLAYAKDSTELEPCLAESWEVSEDGLSYTFKLRQGVKFHDGTDFNADAVKVNIDRQLPPLRQEDMPYASFVYADVKDVVVVDEYTVQINLTKKNTAFLANLAMSLAAPIASPTALEANGGNLNESPVGTGPYKFVEWNPSEDIILTRNDEYWREPAKTKNIVFKFIPDNSARIVALKSGEVDMIDGIDSTGVDQIKADGNELYNVSGMNINYMAYNTTRAPFDNVAVRTALSKAVNVPELVTALYGDYAELATTILPTFMPGYSADVKQVEYDPEAAKAELAAAGFNQPIKMIVYNNPRPYNARNKALAESIQSYWSKVGVEVTIEDYDWTTYKDKVVAGDYDVCFYGWIGDNGDPDNFLNLLCDQSPAMNVAKLNDEKLSAMIAEGTSTEKGEARNTIYTEAEKYIASLAVWLPISHANSLSAYSPAVQNYTYHPTGNIFFREMYKNK